MLAAVDWTKVLLALIGIVPGIVSAMFAYLIHRAVKTPSGKSLGAVVEYAHDTAIANNMLLRHKNGPVKQATKDELRAEAAEGPLVPDTESSKGG